MRQTRALVLLTFNEIEALPKLFDRITVASVDEFFVVDGGSKDGTVEYLREKGVKVLGQPRRGRGCAFAVALEAAKSDALCFYSPDGNEDPEDIPRLFAKLESGGYDRHLRRLRTVLARQTGLFSQAIAKYFPDSTRISRPEGGYVLWVELPARLDSVQLHRAALEAGISISPGPIFSAKGNFKNCVRINCGTLWSDRVDRSLLKLGKLCERLR